MATSGLSYDNYPFPWAPPSGLGQLSAIITQILGLTITYISYYVDTAKVKQRFKLDISVSNREHMTHQEKRRGVSRYHCGKLGHMARECRSRLAMEKQTHGSHPGVTQNQTPQVTASREKKPVVCFSCQQVGHKSPNCPKKLPSVKRIQIPMSKVVSLKPNEVLGTVEGHVMPIICDSGAEISVVPEECVG